MTESTPPAAQAAPKASGRRLEGQTALITGGAQGIGLAIARHFAAEGAQLFLVDVDEAAVGRSAEALTAEFGGQAAGMKADVTSYDQAEAAVKAAVDKFGKIDILVNNAGITRDNLLIRMSEQEWDLVLDVNLKGAFNFSKAAARPMMKARKGRIVNIASVVGMMGNPGQANYAASKAGLIGMTKAIAKELAGRNILVNAVAPGFIRTRLTDGLSEEVKKYMISITPLARFGEPEDVAKAVLFLASDDAGYITGQVIGVNGGMLM